MGLGSTTEPESQGYRRRFLHIRAKPRAYRRTGDAGIDDVWGDGDEEPCACVKRHSRSPHTDAGIYTEGRPGVRALRGRGTVIQRTGGQDRRRKSLILNGARTDIARELEIDEGRQRENEKEREREREKERRREGEAASDIVKNRAEGIYRDLMSGIGRVVPARPVRQSWTE